MQRSAGPGPRDGTERIDGDRPGVLQARETKQYLATRIGKLQNAARAGKPEGLGSGGLSTAPGEDPRTTKAGRDG